MHSKRRTAKEHNERYYFTGRACPNNHVSPRFTSNGGCTACLSKLQFETVSDLDDSRKCNKCGTVFTGKRCRQCRKVLTSQWASRNREYLAQAQRIRVNKCRTFSRELRRNTPCADCHKKWSYWIMEFDHIGEKTTNVSALIGPGNLKRLQEEIAKCQIVCANCHRDRTHRRALGCQQRTESTQQPMTGVARIV